MAHPDEANASAERRWLAAWKAAGPALEEQRRLELRNLSAERALFLSEAVLSMVRPQDLAARRHAESGLVRLQELFRRLPRP